MKTLNLHQLEIRLTRQSFVLLVLAVIYGIAAGAVVTMYYEVVPGMDAIEDRLGSVQAILYILAAGSAFIHVPGALQALKNKAWKQVFVRAGLIIGPFFVFLGADGLVSHWLWWGPLSDTGRYHMLHHSVIGGAPLVLLYGLARRFWLNPAHVSAVPVSRTFLAIGAGLVLVFALAVGVLFGSPAAGLILIAGLAVSVIYSVFKDRKTAYAAARTV